MTEPPSLGDHVLSIVIQAPRQAVWDEITKTGAVQRALYNTVLETDLEPGSRLRYYSPDRKRVFIIGEVVEVEPPVRFVHTYVMTQNPEPPTLVTWQLEEVGDGCRVTLTHSGWTEAHRKPEKVAGGWRQILGLLKAELETGTLPLGARVMYRVMGAMMWALPARTRTENVAELEQSTKR
jgi:uncharacterized protein YndB with AHSA1/START domain